MCTYAHVCYLCLVSYFWDRDFHCTVTWQSRLRSTDQWTPCTCLSLPPQCWDYKRHLFPTPIFGLGFWESSQTLVCQGRHVTNWVSPQPPVCHIMTEQRAVSIWKVIGYTPGFIVSLIISFPVDLFFFNVFVFSFIRTHKTHAFESSWQHKVVRRL